MVASAVLYIALAAGVAMGAPWVQAFDGAVQSAVFPLRSDALTPGIAFTSDLSDTVPCLVVVAAVLVYLLAARRFKAAGLYAGTLATAEVLVEGSKFLLSRPRPYGMNLVEFPWNASFPSGHTFVAIVAVGFAVFVLVKLHPQWPKRGSCRACDGRGAVGDLHRFHPHLPGGALAHRCTGFGVAVRRCGASRCGASLATDYSRIEASASNSFSISMGFARWPSMPHRSAFWRSSSKASAVMARMGMLASCRSSIWRMAWVAS